MSNSLSPVPEGYPTVAPYLIVDDAPRIITFLEDAFGGTLVRRAEDEGRVMHAEVRVGDSIVMMGSASEEWPALRAMIHLYLPDVDAVYRRALEAGGTVVREPETMPYGDRSGGVMDPAGNQWWIATRVADPDARENGE